MPQQKSIYTQAVNIRLHNHRNANYADLIRFIYRRKIRVNYRSNDYLMISSLRTDTRSENILRGTLARFVEIDPDADWLDIETGEAADQETRETIRIPENLRPNLSSFFFRFNIERHLLVFESYGKSGSLSAGSVKKFIEGALSEPNVVQQFGQSEVTIVADHANIEQLFTYDRLTRIKISIERPNDLGEDEIEANVLEELESENARKLERETYAVHGQSLDPSERTIALAKVAARNGSVETHGQENEVMKDKSTRDIPLREGLKYDEEVQAEENAFDQAADRITDRYLDT